jgi:hypothetical protein
MSLYINCMYRLCASIDIEILFYIDIVMEQEATTGRSSPSKPTPSYSSSNRVSAPKAVSPYKSSYTTSRYVYSSHSYQPLMMNSMYLYVIENHAYVSMFYTNVDKTQYCPLNNCPPVNSTYIHTLLKGNVSMSIVHNDTLNIQNATQIDLKLMSKYGCSINFGNCLESSASSNSLYNGYIMLIIMFIHVMIMRRPSM